MFLSAIGKKAETSRPEGENYIETVLGVAMLLRDPISMGFFPENRRELAVGRLATQA